MNNKKPKKPKKTTRSPRGTGSVFFHKGRQRYVARKVVNGEKVERWGKTQAEAIAKRDAALPPDKKTVTVAQWAERWRATLTGRVSTKSNSRISLDHHILPALGHVRLAAVSTNDIKQLIADMLASGTGAGTVGKIVSHARMLFAAAVADDLIQRNPAAGAKKPRHSPAEIQTYTPEQLVRIIDTAPQFASGGVIATLAATGMRIGEVLALDVADWNPTAGTLSITKTYSLKFGIGPPKSRHSVRDISAPDVLFQILNDAADGRDSGPLFLTEGGKRRPAQTVAKGWKATLKATRLLYRKLHCLRHSVATALIAGGDPLPDVAKYIGDTVATLVKCYVHPTGADPAHTLNRLYGVRKVGDIPTTLTERKESQRLVAIA